MTLPQESRRLLEALVDIYPRYVRHRIDDPPGCIDSAIEEGRAWLTQALTDLLSRPFPEQRRGPLEVFQEAMRFPTECLRSQGREPTARDPVAQAALPGDLYDLAPSSSRALGEDVWQAHLAWGIRKAGSLGAPPPAGSPDEES